jgi:hypothetical protein
MRKLNVYNHLSDHQRLKDLQVGMELRPAVAEDLLRRIGGVIK